jgi:hypothetical protein
MYLKSDGRLIPENGRKKSQPLHPYNKPNTSYSQKQEARQKEKKKQKKKNVSDYGKLKEFPTFRHDKPTTNQLLIIFKKNDLYSNTRINLTLYRHYRIYSQICIAISGRVKKEKRVNIT